MSEPSWWSYIRRVAGTETGRVIAEAAGVSEPQVSRWKSGKNTPDADKMVQFARYYNRPPLEALIAAGYLRHDEAGGDIEVHTKPAELSDEELLAEIRKRMEARHVDSSPGTQESATSSQTSQDEKMRRAVGRRRSSVRSIANIEPPAYPPEGLATAAESGGPKGIETAPGDEEYSQDPDDHPSE